MLIVEVISATKREDIEVAQQSEPAGTRGQAKGLSRKDTKILSAG